MRIVVGSDHAGFELKQELLGWLAEQGHTVSDLGVHEPQSVDYPDFARPVALAVASGEADRGLLCCGTGQGMAMTANKVAGVRAAVCADTFSAHATREHNNANVLCLGQRVVGGGLARDILAAFLGAEFEGGRHARRVGKIEAAS